MRKSGSQKGKSPSRMIDARIKELGDWRGKMLSQLRTLIKQADPEVVEEWKWRGVPVWSHDGLICTGETYKNVVKMTFAKGAALKDPSGLFNSSLDGSVRRAIDIHEGDKVDEAALKELIRAAVALNLKGKRKPKPRPASNKRPGVDHLEAVAGGRTIRPRGDQEGRAAPSPGRAARRAVRPRARLPRDPGVLSRRRGR